MRNSSQISHFILGAYFDTGPLRWLYFLIIMCVYALIVLSNLLLIVVISFNRTLHEPMYIFLCSLFINEIYGSTVVLPFVMFHILQDVHTVSYSLCFLQIFCLYSYGGLNFTNLAIMSYDRYVAICFPLQYNTYMNSKKVAFLIVLIWIPPFVAVGITVILSTFLKLCGNVLDSIYCDNYYIVKLSCSDTTVINLWGLVALTVTIILPVSVIFFTYIRILKVCFNGSKQTRQKALSTCTPHLCSLINFSIGPIFSVVQSRINVSHLSKTYYVLRLFHTISEPLVNTLVYGLNLSKIRNVCKSLLLKSKNKIMIELK